MSWQRSDFCSFALVPPTLSPSLCTRLNLTSHKCLTLCLWHPWKHQLWRRSGVTSFASLEPGCEPSSAAYGLKAQAVGLAILSSLQHS